LRVKHRNQGRAPAREPACAGLGQAGSGTFRERQVAIRKTDDFTAYQSPNMEKPENCLDSFFCFSIAWENLDSRFAAKPS
jgi:hypothetical protein